MNEMSAIFSPCGKYRYQLTQAGKHQVGWVMLNGSIADGKIDDPTIRKVRGFSKDWGYDGFVVSNAYGGVSTDPKGLWEMHDPIGPDNDAYLMIMATMPMIVVAWGGNIESVREYQVTRILQSLGAELFSLGRNMDNTPKHPLYVPYRQKLERWSFDRTVKPGDTPKS